MERESRRSPMVAPLSIVIGGALIIVSNFLHWGRVAATNGSGHRDLKGGTPVLIAGIVAVLLGIALWVLRTQRARLVVSIIAIVGGILAVLIGAIGLSTDFIRNTIADQLGDEAGISHPQAEQDLKQSEEAGKIETTRQPGIYFTLAGGVLVLIGGIGGLAMGRGTRAPEPGLARDGAGPFAAPPPPETTDAEPWSGVTVRPAGEGSGAEPPPPPPPPSEPMPAEEPSPADQPPPEPASGDEPPPETPAPA